MHPLPESELELVDRCSCDYDDLFRKTSEAVEGQLSERIAGRPRMLTKEPKPHLWAPGPTDRLRDGIKFVPLPISL